MRTMNQPCRFLALWLSGLLFLTGAQAAGPDTSAPGIRHVSGGIGIDERQALQEQQAQYNFWLKTAIKRSGAYLSGVRVRIVDAGSKKLALEHTMGGPWLFATLPAGRYEVEAHYRSSATGSEQTLRKTTDLRSGEHHQMMLYFEGSDEVGSGNGLEHTPPPRNGAK